MGFGLICAGYSTLLFMRLVPVELIGFIFVLKGLMKLRNFNRFFNFAEKSVYPILLFSFIDCIYWIINYFGIATIGGADGILTYVHRIVYLPFYLFLFAALRSISNEVGYPKGMKRASLAMSTAIVYYLVFALSRITMAGFERYFVIAEYLFYLLLVIITESAIYTCYRAITTDEAEQKEEEELAKFEARFGKNRNKNSKEEPKKQSKK